MQMMLLIDVGRVFNRHQITLNYLMNLDNSYLEPSNISRIWQINARQFVGLIPAKSWA